MTDGIQPLDPALWFRRIEVIASGEIGSVENSLRHAFHLLQLAPREIQHLVRLPVDEEHFEALLDSGDLDSAARHLVAKPTAISVEEDLCLGRIGAAISCPVLRRTFHGNGATVAIAMLDAWTSFVLALRSEFEADLVSLAGPPLHTGQFGLHRLPS